MLIFFVRCYDLSIDFEFTAFCSDFHTILANLIIHQLLINITENTIVHESGMECNPYSTERTNNNGLLVNSGVLETLLDLIRRNSKNIDDNCSYGLFTPYNSKLNDLKIEVTKKAAE